MPDLSRRSTEPELLDAGVPEAEVRRSLADLRLVNRFLGGRRALLRTVVPLLARMAEATPAAAPRPVVVLDVGCGSADLPGLLPQYAPRPLRVLGLDLKPEHLRDAPAGVLRVAADVRALPFVPGSVDVVTASLFLHHFDDHDLPELLRSLYALARVGLVVNDLRRAHVAHVFARLAFPWLLRSPVSVQDGLVSIRRAFTAAELRHAFTHAGIPAARVRRSFPYRLVAVAARPAPPPPG